jgi:MFS family permease
VGEALAADELDTDAGPSGVRSSFDALRASFRNRSIRRVQVALAVSMIGDWAYATAVTVWAFEVGGAKAVGVWGAIRYTLMALTAPAAASLADRFPRKAVMIGADLLQVLVTTTAALFIFADGPTWPVFVLATICSLLGSVFRPAQMALMPSLADTPEELAASNGAASTIESLSFFIGPAIGAFLIALFDIEIVFLFNAASFVVTAVLVAGVHARPADPSEEPAAADAGDDVGMLQEMLAGFSEIVRDRGLLVVNVLVMLQTVVAGATLVLSVVFALEILRSGSEGVGYINSFFGVGAILGGLFAIAVSTRDVLARNLAAGVLLWSLPLLCVAAWPEPLVMIAAVAVMGFGNPLVDVNYVTLTQRLARDEVLGRVFGAGEGALIATMAVGSAVTPFLITELGLRTTLLVLGLGIAVPSLLLLEACRRLDARLVAPPGTDLLLAIPIFAPLARSQVEALARGLVAVDVAAGEEVMEEGDPADRFFIVESGGVDITSGPRFIEHTGAGGFFGEIGLLRNVRRTATVTATEPTRLLSLGRAEFLDAVAGSAESGVVAHDIVSRRMMV